MQNLLTNGSTDGGWTRRTHTGVEYGEIFVPEGWVAFWWEGGPVAHDLANPDGYGRPEMHVINREAPYLDPPRIHSGERALKLFTFYRIHDAGIYQTVSGITPGTRLRAGGWAHAWSSTQDDPRCSTGANVGCGGIWFDEGTPGLDDGDRNVTFRVGIDPTGAADPWADTVVWGPGRHIYNAYAEIPELEIEAEAETVTVFLRSSVLWPFKHCDAYFDDAYLIAVEVEPPAESYDRYVIMADPTYMDAAKLDTAYDRGRAELRTVTPSWNDAVQPAATRPREWQSNTVNAGPLPAGDRDLYREWVADRDPETVLVFDDEEHGDVWRPHTYIPTGTKLGWHAIGNCGLPELHATLQSPTIKLLQAIGDIGKMPARYRVVRLIDWPGYGKLEGFDYNGDPETQAEARIGALAKILEPWEGKFDWAEYINEQDIPDLAGAAKLARFVKRAMEVAPGWLGLAHFSFGPGNPSDLTYWQPIADAGVFELIAERGDAIALHSYHDHRVPDDMTWLLLRHRFLYDEHILPRMLDIPMLLTECGPWRHLLPDQTFDLMDWVRATDAALAEDPYAMAHMYTVSDVEGWEDYNRAFKAIYPAFISYAESVKDRVNPGATVVVPAPPEEPGPVPFSQRDARWAGIKLGESDYTMGGAGCLVTAFASLLTLTDPEMTPLKLVTWLNEHEGFTDTGRLWIAKPAEMTPDWDFVAYHTWRKEGQTADLATVRRLLSMGPTIIQVDFKPATSALDSHFVLALREEGNDIEIMDPWRGTVDRLRESYGPDRTLEQAIYAAVEYKQVDDEPAQPPAEPVFLGFNDHDGQSGTGLKWLQDNGLRNGLIVRPLFLGGTPVAVDARQAEADGIRVILNLRYSWSTDCGGAGTLPLPYSRDWGRFIDAAANTIRGSQGVWGYTIGNEANNPREWPRDGRLQPGDVAAAYNMIRDRVADLHTRMAVGALDPYNAQAGDPRSWLGAIYRTISGAEFVAAHGYVRGPDPALVGSTAKFQDEPLTWQYLNYPGSVTALLQALPAGYGDLPVYVTEFNHLWTDGGEGSWGWVDDARAAEIVKRAHIAAEYMGIAGLALYRWAGDQWTIEGKTHILEAVRARLS
ncbi:MAG: hypothetical protein JXC32_20670 [Anaerolineae bacterium]|nr:hypothetical protein [Anaerolineae bacterium]